MMLVFGGTGEGKKVAELMDVTGHPYFYSTRTPTRMELKGVAVSGEMGPEGIRAFCREKGIRLIIDAGHPFAVHLHKHIHMVSQELKIPVIRYERRFPELKESGLLRLFPDYRSMVRAILQSSHERILALTGVQTIGSLRELPDRKTCFFRILDSDDSRKKARDWGLPDAQVIPMQPQSEAEGLIALVRTLNIDLMLSKESGVSGYFQVKQEASRILGIPLWVVRRPTLPDFEHSVSGRKEILRLFFRLKKKYLRDPEELKNGYTTGSCVTAAARACFIALVDGVFPEYSEIILPGGEKAVFPVFGGKLRGMSASCVVIKDAGDDPDVTHAKEIGCELLLREKPGVSFLQGEGVGRVSLPGLGLEVGSPAINPVPRKMITEMLEELSASFDLESGFDVTPFVPEGRTLAGQTFNPRVGVRDGISIIGTSGKVLPYSHEAFVGSLRQQINVAREMGCDEILISSGKRGERALSGQFPGLLEQAFIHYGNLVGETLKMAAEAGILRVNLSLMFGKAVKLAEGHLDTHSRRSSFNPDFLAGLARESGHPEDLVQKIRELKLANALPDLIPFSAKELFYRKIARACLQTCLRVFPSEGSLWLFLVVGKNGIVRVNSEEEMKQEDQ